MTRSASSDARVVAPVHAQSTVEDILLPRHTEGAHEVLRAALEAGDVATLKVLAPGLQRVGALSLIYHTGQQAKAASAGRYCYGSEAWGTKPPLRVLEATLAVRAALLQERSCRLTLEDARRVAREAIIAEIEDGLFWRFPLWALLQSDSRRATQLLCWRAKAVESELLAHAATDLARIHAATAELLADAGLTFDLLGRYARGARGEADAVARLAASQAHDAQAMEQHWRDTLGR